uniref:MULE transposase domain-containing protein n=1 Tax=Timema cristinae TaxID=61476 RepID=A0A7R9GVW6_TIMCR|nr:unnamed protein product [Timema cristinae]
MDDSGSKDDRILIFSTRRNSQLLGRSEHWYADGTFKTVPPLSEHLFTIHGFEANNSVPPVCELLADKRQGTYSRLLRKVKELEPASNPRTFMTDFEMLMINAVKDEYPLTNHRGCLLHCCQCISRKIQTNGLKLRYENGAYFSLKLLMLPALAFVPTEEVVGTFDSLYNSNVLLQEVDVWIALPKTNNNIEGSNNIPLEDIAVFGNLSQQSRWSSLSMRCELSSTSVGRNLVNPMWSIVDPICTFLFSVLVLLTTFAIIKDAIVVLMEGPGVNPQKILHQVNQEIHSRFNFFEMTLQIEEFDVNMEHCSQCQGPESDEEREEGKVINKPINDLLQRQREEPRRARTIYRREQDMASLTLIHTAPREVILTTSREVILTAPHEVILTAPREVIHTAPREVIHTAPREVILTTSREVILTAPREVILTTPREVILTAPREVILTAPREVIHTAPRVRRITFSWMFDVSISWWRVLGTQSLRLLTFGCVGPVVLVYFGGSMRPRHEPRAMVVRGFPPSQGSVRHEPRAMAVEGVSSGTRLCPARTSPDARSW